MMDYEALPLGFLTINDDVALMGEEAASSPIKALEALAKTMKNSAKEASFVLCLDVGSRPICAGVVAYGDNKNVTAGVKEICQFALLTNADSVILVHNHPSYGKDRSSLAASKDDYNATFEVMKALSLFGIHLTDHIITNSKWMKYEHLGATRDVKIPAFYSMRSDRKFLAMQKSVYRSVMNEKDHKPAEVRAGFSGKTLDELGSLGKEV